MKKEKIKLLIVGVVALGIGFLGGMEYKAYQLRIAVNDAFSGVFEEEGNNKATSAETEEASEAASNDLTNKIGFEVTEKGFVEYDYQNYITFTFKFTNKTDKDIEGVKGQVTLNDLFGDNIQQLSLSYDEGIAAGESRLYKATVDYNQFIDDDIKLRNTDLSKIKYDLDVGTIIYTDGTQETY